MHRQATAVSGPLPSPGKVRLLRERRIQSRQGDEERVSLDLSGERMNGDERIG